MKKWWSKYTWCLKLCLRSRTASPEWQTKSASLHSSLKGAFHFTNLACYDFDISTFSDLWDVDMLEFLWFLIFVYFLNWEVWTCLAFIECWHLYTLTSSELWYFYNFESVWNSRCWHLGMFRYFRDVDMLAFSVFSYFDILWHLTCWPFCIF